MNGRGAHQPERFFGGRYPLCAGNDRRFRNNSFAHTGCIIAARDRLGRLPVLVGQAEDGCCVSFESFAYHKLGYSDAYELGPGEIIRLTAMAGKHWRLPGKR